MKAQPRDSRFELLRIISILMIVLSHFSLFGQEYRLSQSSSWLTTFGAGVFLPYGKIGVTLFVLITGYFLGKKEISIFSAINRAWKVWIETFFYSFILCLTFVVATHHVDVKLAIQSVIPMSTNLYWFVSAYIIMMLFLPIINLTINQINKDQFKYLIIICLLMDTFIPLLKVNYECMVLSPYFLGAYIQRYRPVIKHKGMYLGVLLSLLYVLTVGLLPFGHGHAFTIGILPRLIGVLIFLFVVELKPFYSASVNSVATSAFAGYLVTEYPLMRDFLWNHLLKFADVQNVYLADFFGAVAIGFILYIGVFLIDKGRQIIFSALNVHHFPTFLKNKFNFLINK